MSISRPFFKNLQPAKWRNLPFGVSSIALSLGRKIAVHEYPYVDGVYAEDLGAKGKAFHVMGFIVEGGGAYGGKGTLKQQLEEFEKAAMQWGDGEFIHPTLGARPKMCLLNLEIEQDQQGRVASLRFTLLENIVNPTVMVVPNAQAQTEALGARAKETTMLETLTEIKKDVRKYRNGILNRVNKFTTTVRQVISTATSLFSMITGLPGEIGRYIGSAIPQDLKTNKSVQQLIGLGSANRVNVINKVDQLSNALDAMDIEKIVNGISDTVSSVFKSNPDPVQALNAMLPFANSQPMPSGTDEATGFNLLNDLIRRTAVICIAESTAKRVYVSYDDAVNTRTIVCQYIDQELKIAGDQGLDATYNALMNLRISVSQDLTRRGADLAKVEQITAAASLPSLVWAQRLYQDSGREKELVKSANPIHPAFMPINFKALSS
ncbi:DNA circularization protein [Acinetobacter venetianus]|uniref:DNA circularization protein n=1 Tax=Acinetobacter venetianus TaxID=52133 RepID=UPI00214FED1A|nr:DNA circularization N-terminal domain-containing protein [Acinetobacter venetianus]MCR4532451.1 DNA circularization N-terminal domain-containing protein [Acinetobacter venetianus]